MSILLEALRKSEKNQNPQEVPTIHSGDPAGSVSEPMKTGPLIIMLVVSLIATGWFVWRQYQAPEGSYQPPVTLPSDKSAAKAGPSEELGTSIPDSDQPVRERPAASRETAGSRTPVESYSAPAASASTSQAASTQSSSGRPEPVADKSVSNTQPAQSKVPGESSSATTGQKDPREPAPISYWELPDAVRAEVPEIKFSVLVYASNPDDRFVLIDGQRLGEGDSLNSGPVVKEIQREGVVFSYRLYQFLVER